MANVIQLFPNSSAENEDKEGIFVASESNKFIYIIRYWIGEQENIHAKAEEKESRKKWKSEIETLAGNCIIAQSFKKGCYKIFNGIPQSLRDKTGVYLSKEHEINPNSLRPLSSSEFNLFTSYVSAFKSEQAD